jgi:tetratricopeptide (TPR) repeat protein
MNLSEEEIKIIQNLLSVDTEITKTALSAIDSDFSDNIGTALIILWQLSSEEVIRDAAKKLLVNTLDALSEKKITRGFEIFRSINRDLPWTNPQAVDIQESNFEAFRNISPNYEKLLATNHLYSEMLLDTGRKLLLIFNLEEKARFCFELIASHNKANDEALFALGRMEERKGETERALDFYEKAIAANPNNSFAQMHAGDIKNSALGRYEEALLHFSKASAQDPYSVEPYVKMAETAFKLNNFPQTKQYLEIALGINEYQEEALNLLGILQWKIEEKYDEAVETFKKGIDHKIHADSALLLKSLGDIYAQHFQEFNKANVFYEKSLKANAQQKSLLEYYAPFMLKHFNDLGAVEKSYIEYLKLKPNDVDILTAYAIFMIDYLNDFDSAYTYLERAVELDPNHQLALKQLRKISGYVENDKHDSSEEDEDEDEEDEDDEEVEIIVLDEDWFDDDEEEEDDDFTGGGAATDN